MPHADVACSGDILTVEREEHGRGGWHNRLLGFGHFFSAPRARDRSAQANGLGDESRSDSRPEGPVQISVPDITLVVGHLMAFQKAPVFFLKCHLLMVPCLVFDVGNDGFCF